MLYTPLTYLAMRIAYDAHHGFLDKSGAPYVFHPYEVALQLDDEVSVCVALLHDVVEDTDLTFDDLRRKGIPDSVIEPLKLLTRDDSESYGSYIRRIGTDPVATRVKIADLTHNMNETRYCRPMNDYECRRQEKYRRAKEYLLEKQKGFEKDRTA